MTRFRSLCEEMFSVENVVCSVVFGVGLFAAGMTDVHVSGDAYRPALSPTVEPVPVSPPDGASIAIAGER